MKNRMSWKILIVCLPLCAFFQIRAQTATYTLSPRTVAVNTPFTLRVQSSAYDSCHYRFTHDTLVFADGRITASFVAVNDTMCSAVVHPFGPSYASPGYAAGKYPVYAQMFLACQFTPPYCPAVYPVPVFVDTLTVTAVVPVLSKEQRCPRVSLLNELGMIKRWWVNGRKGP